MIKLKGLKKKLLRLEASMQKDARRLAKLKRKIEVALKAEAAPVKVNASVRVAEASKPAQSAASPAKKKRTLTPGGREKLSAMMKARWAAKRAGTAPAGEPQRTEA